MSRINRVKQACCAMNGMKKMFNERWFGPMNYLYMVKNVKWKLNTRFLWKKKQARYRKKLFSVFSALKPRTCFIVQHHEHLCFACSFIDHYEHIYSFADPCEHCRAILFGKPMFDLYRWVRCRIGYSPDSKFSKTRSIFCFLSIEFEILWVEANNYWKWGCEFTKKPEMAGNVLIGVCSLLSDNYNIGY